MKYNLMKIFFASIFMIFLCTGISSADGGHGHHRGYAHGHYQHRAHHHYHHAPPPPVYVEHHYRPVVVERHYYPAPVYDPAPAPRGFFFGMSGADAGSAFSFGVSGR